MVDSAQAHAPESWLSVFTIPERCSHHFGLSLFLSGPLGFEEREELASSKPPLHIHSPGLLARSVSCVITMTSQYALMSQVVLLVSHLHLKVIVPEP